MVDFISTCAGVGGGWRRIVNINISAGDDCGRLDLDVKRHSIPWVSHGKI